MYMCPERATMCKDIASGGSFIKRVTCFNCLGPHGVKDCPHDRYCWTILKNKCLFFEALDQGKVFMGIPITSNSGTIASNSMSVPTTMAPPAPLPTKYHVLVERFIMDGLEAYKLEIGFGDE